MTTQDFSKLLVNASSALLECGTALEEKLKHVLLQADACGPEVAFVVAETLTTLCQDIATAPVMFTAGKHESGDVMVGVIETLGVVLFKSGVERCRSKRDFKHSVRVLDRAIKKHKLRASLRVRFLRLMKEIALVYVELRQLLKRQKTHACKNLFKSVQHFLRRASPSLLCFAYNSMKLKVCLASVSDCSTPHDRSTVKAIVKNLLKLRKQTRAMSVVSPVHKETLTEALKMAKDSAETNVL